MDDGVDCLAPIADSFEKIAIYPSLMNLNADRDLDVVWAAWSDHARFIHVPTATLTLSCLLDAGRFDELLALLDRKKPRLWFDEKFGAEALLCQGLRDQGRHARLAQPTRRPPPIALDADGQRSGRGSAVTF